MKKNLSELYKDLKSLGLPITYYEWEKGKVPDLPYLVYYETGKDIFYADNESYYLRNVITVELYTDYKDEELEALLESFFNAQNISLINVEENFWSDEHLHEVSYEFEL